MSDVISYLKRELDFLLDWLNKLENTINTLAYNKNDIRYSYFSMSKNNVKQYYISYSAYLTSYLINTNKYSESCDFPIGVKQHLMELKAFTKDPSFMFANFNTLNQRVYIMAWSLFELSISTIFETYADDRKKDKYINSLYSNIKNKIKEGEADAVKKKLKISSSHFIPIPKKYGHLIDLCGDGYGKKENDLKFLEFFGKLRNTVHSNFIYYGNPYEYKFGDAHFVFKNGEVVKWKDPFAEVKKIPSVKLYIYLIGELNNIFLKIINCLHKVDYIEFPDLTAE